MRAPASEPFEGHRTIERSRADVAEYLTWAVTSGALPGPGFEIQRRERDRLVARHPQPGWARSPWSEVEFRFESLGGGRTEVHWKAVPSGRETWLGGVAGLVGLSLGALVAVVSGGLGWPLGLAGLIAGLVGWQLVVPHRRRWLAREWETLLENLHYLGG